MNQTSAKAKIFIDGQAGTTGLQITERLAHRDDLELVFLADDDARKDPAHRAACLREADVAILCLPDDAAREAVRLADGECRILDASTAHRTADQWIYGLPELEPDQRHRIASADRVSNPGCYPQGFILLVRPLIDAGLLAPTTLLRCNAISGYSGGGRQMIEQRTTFTRDQREDLCVQAYGLELTHKHLPEMRLFAGLQEAPIFTPVVGHFHQGMLVQIPLFTEELQRGDPQTVHATLCARYAAEPFIEVLPLHNQSGCEGSYLNATACNHTNRMQLMLYGNQQRMLLCARYDNLGKGASGAAVQNLNLMLGINETVGL